CQLYRHVVRQHQAGLHACIPREIAVALPCNGLSVDVEAEAIDLVRGEWRQYQQNLTNSASTSGTMSVGAVSIEENNDKTPVN
ncbi:hypothetical protein, partial [Prevotella intermedia]|uniref:hypothetical protein n=1 Tax=Prevotella intermedia TaxID=28131 RepID=UPI0021515549